MLLILLMSKGSKEALTVLIVTHVAHVERVESGVCGLYTQYRYIQCYVERVERLCYVKTRVKQWILCACFRVRVQKLFLSSEN